MRSDETHESFSHPVFMVQIMKSCLAWTFFAIAILFGIATFAVSFPIMLIVMIAILLA
jgi:hypothetical protein